MSDIVPALRAFNQKTTMYYPIVEIAADEIEALRAEVERLTQERNEAEGAAIIRKDDWRADDLEQFQQQRDAALAEVERLRAALVAIRDIDYRGGRSEESVLAYHALRATDQQNEGQS